MRNTRTFLLMLATAVMLRGQTVTTSEITGTLTDSTGAVVTAATVLLKSADTGEARTAPSNAFGTYRFALVKPGTYGISAVSAGLRSADRRVNAAVGQVLTMDLTLQLEEAKEQVQITDGAPVLDTDNANIMYPVSTRQLELLPLAGGDLVGVVYSLPTVVINNRYGNGNFAAQGIGSSSNMFTVNGVDEIDPYWNINNSGTSGMLLGANEIQEASVVQNAYEGQYGRQAGMQVNYVSKSGTNSYHGSLLENYTGTLLTANDFFNNRYGVSRSHEVSNQYAGAVGGPLRRDKLFFFADTEGFRAALPASQSVVATPSPAFQRYSLSTILPSQIPLYQSMFDVYNSAPGHERAVPVTNGAGPFQDASGQLGCGALTGTPTGTGGVFGKDVSCAQAWGANTPSDPTEWLLSTRVDYNVNAKHRLFFRFKTDHGFLPYGTSPINPAFNTISNEPDYEGQFNYTYVVTPRLINNLIGSGTYNDYIVRSADLASALKLFPFRFNIFDGGANGSFGLTGIGAPAAYPSGRRAGQLQVVDDISYSIGRHSLKAGINYRYNRQSDLSYSRNSLEGRFNFYGLDNLADGAIDPSSGSNYFRLFTSTPVLHLRFYSLGTYVQDQWAITPRFKVTASVRFDRNGNPECLDECFARLVSPFPSLEKGLGIPYNQSIQTGLSHAFYDGEAVILQPRLGVAYNPTWSKRTVFRGGVGVFSDLYPSLFGATMAGNAPNVFFSTIQTGLVATSGADSAPAIAAASAGAFQRQFASGATLAQLQQAVAPASFSAPGYFSLPSTLRTPKYLEWSFEIQEQIGAKAVVTARYAGNHGYDIFLPNAQANASVNPALYPSGFAGLSTTTPDPRFQGVTQLTNDGYSNYDGLTVAYRHDFSHGFQGQVGYTWSHALDMVSNGGLVGLGNIFSYDSLGSQINPLDPRPLTYSNADYDIRHLITGDFLWEIPVKSRNRWMRTILAGWSAGSRLNTHTGIPFTVYNSQLANRLGPSFGGTVLADVLDPNIQTTCGRPAVDTPCFTASQFATTRTQTDLGNRPRNSFRAPADFNFDSSLYRSISAGESRRLTFGVSAYNLLNHPNFADPNGNVLSSGLGLISHTVPNPSSPYGLWAGPTGRVVVLSGRLTF